MDLAPLDEAEDPSSQVRKIERELRHYGAGLMDKERWLVLNKLDLLDAAEAAARRDRLLDELGWRGPVHAISALTGAGTAELMADLMHRLEALRQAERSEETPAAAEEGWHPLD